MYVKFGDQYYNLSSFRRVWVEKGRPNDPKDDTLVMSLDVDGVVREGRAWRLKLDNERAQAFLAWFDRNSENLSAPAASV